MSLPSRRERPRLGSTESKPYLKPSFTDLYHLLPCSNPNFLIPNIMLSRSQYEKEGGIGDVDSGRHSSSSELRWAFIRKIYASLPSRSSSPLSSPPLLSMPAPSPTSSSLPAQASCSGYSSSSFLSSIRYVDDDEDVLKMKHSPEVMLPPCRCSTCKQLLISSFILVDDECFHHHREDLYFNKEHDWSLLRLKEEYALVED